MTQLSTLTTTHKFPSQVVVADVDEVGGEDEDHAQRDFAPAHLILLRLTLLPVFILRLKGDWNDISMSMAFPYTL